MNSKVKISVFDLLEVNLWCAQTKVQKKKKNENEKTKPVKTVSLDDIWSHNFHNAIMSRVFKKGVIYVQHQDHHNM